MPWVKLDDSFPEHAKVERAGEHAGWMYVVGLCYCSRANTDGFISEARMRKLTSFRNAAKLAAALVREGLWELAEGGYRVHDYHDYQPTAAEISARRKANADRVRAHRNRKRTQDVTHYNSVTDGVISAHAGTPASGWGGELTDKDQGEDKVDARTLINQACVILDAIPLWEPNEMGVENAHAMYPNVDLLQGCRLAVTWASDPSWEIGSCTATLRSALRKLDADRKPQATAARRTAAMQSLMARAEPA
jgi:hypothetical protein